MERNVGASKALRSGPAHEEWTFSAFSICPARNSDQEMFAGNSGLTNDGLQRADSYRPMQRHGDGDRAAVQPLLHDHVAALLPRANETSGFHDLDNFQAGKHPEFRHIPPRYG